MVNELPVPDFLDISPETQAAATAAMSQGTVLTPPEDAVMNKDKKNNEYFRWSEGAVIESAWRETTKSGLISAVVQAKIRVGFPNSGQRVWGRHMMHPALLSGTADDATAKKYDFMNNKSINALTTLLNSTKLMPDSGGISGKLLNYVFPIKNSPGASSPFKGKSVILNLVDSPNTGEGAKTPRQTSVETYLPDEG
jgi:hypothetical protein